MRPRRFVVPVLLLVVSGCASDATAPTSFPSSTSTTSSLPEPTTTTTTTRAAGHVNFEVLGVGQARLSMLGQVGYATIDEDYLRLWSLWEVGSGILGSPAAPEGPPHVDMDQYVVLFYNRAEDGCPDDLKTLEIVDGQLVPTFVPPPGACILPLIAVSFAVAISRTSVPARFVAYLEGYPRRTGTIQPETRLPIDLRRVMTSDGLPLLMRCGTVVTAYRRDPPAAVPMEGYVDALVALEADPEGDFADDYLWGVWAHTPGTLTLFGTGSDPDDHARATFDREPDGSWRPTGFGGCSWFAETSTQGGAIWILDSDQPPTPATTTLHLVATERNCASGIAPEAEDVTHLVVESDTSVTIIILVEWEPGFATCQGNPSFDYSVELPNPLGDRTLIDGATIPGTPR